METEDLSMPPRNSWLGLKKKEEKSSAKFYWVTGDAAFQMHDAGCLFLAREESESVRMFDHPFPACAFFVFVLFFCLFLLLLLLLFLCVVVFVLFVCCCFVLILFFFFFFCFFFKWRLARAH